MKKSTQYNIVGLLLFVAGSMIVQMYIDTLLFIGLIALLLGWMSINAYIDLERAEKSLQDFEVKAEELRIKMKENLDEHENNQPKTKDN